MALHRAATAWVERTLIERTVFRRLHVPPHASAVAIGGSTLGGSGKTSLAISCAAELARSGARVALVGHAYRGDPRYPRTVSPGDEISDVGDEALLAARELDGSAVQVVVAPSRAEAMARAARSSDVLVLDGIAQLTPEPTTLAILSLDALEPWGRRVSLPWHGSLSGFLRAPVSMLVRACDAIVTTGDDDVPERLAAFGRPVWPSRIESRGAWAHGGALMTWESIRRLRVGLLTALARPERLVHWLQRRRVVPRAVFEARDHGPFAVRMAGDVARAASTHGIDLWLATPKCALHLEWARPTLRVGVIDHAVILHPELRNRLRAIAVGVGSPVSNQAPHLDPRIGHQ